MKRQYLKATGSACYNATGITFPTKNKFNLKELLENHGCKCICWARQFGWDNQPKVLTFSGDEIALTSVRASLIRLQFPLIMVKHWRE